MAQSSKQPTTKPDSLGLDTFCSPSESTPGLSLDQLCAAFAEMLSTGDDPYREPEASSEPAEKSREEPSEHSSAESAAEGACDVTPRTILEAMLFVGSPTNEPLRAEQVASLMRGVRAAEIDQLVEQLNVSYQERGSPYYIASEGAGYRLTLRPEFHRVRDRFYGKARQARLSQAAIEVLSLVAYNQPISAEEINRQRGTASGAVLNQLVRRELLRLDRSDPEHRKGRYYTTDRFLQLFNLESLDELPQSEDHPS